MDGGLTQGKSNCCEFVMQLSREMLAFDLDQGGFKWRLVPSELPDDAHLLQEKVVQHLA